MLALMTQTDPLPKLEDAHAGLPVLPADVPKVRTVCPYLAGGDGGWRSAHPSRDHRCAAVLPPTQLAPGKQRSLCLGPGHAGCVTFTAADELAYPSPASGPAAAGLWPEVVGGVLALDSVHSRRPLFAGRQIRGAGQALLVGLMGVAFLVLVIARTTGPGGDASPSSVPFSSPTTAVISPSPSPSDDLPATAQPSLPATPEPSGKPGSSATIVPTPAPSSGTTYKVKSGDTLSAIAARFGVTVKALKSANGITGTNVIHPGQVLVIPPRA